MTRFHLMTIAVFAAITSSIFMPFSQSFALEPVIIDDTLTSKIIGRNIDYFEDTKKAISFEEVLRDDTIGSLPWTRSTVDKLGFGFKKASYWVRFSLMNPTARDIELYLHQEYCLIDYLTVYEPDGKGRYTTITTGNRYPFHQRPYEYKNFIFPLIIKAGATETLYLRYANHGSNNIHLSVVEPQTFEETKDNEAIFFWMFYGIFFVMFVFNFFIFLSTRELAYFYYIMYLASFGLFTMALGGMGFQYLWPHNTYLGKMPVSITMAIIIISIVEFAIHFINIRMFSKIWYYLLKIVVFAAYGLLAMALVTWNYWFSIISTNALTGVAASIGLISVTYIVIVKKSRQAYFFFGSFTLFLVGVIVVVLFYRGVVPGTVLTINGIYIGAIFQVVTLSFGLADKIKSMKNELGVLNTGLEEKVADRTAELQAVNEEMTVTNRNLIEARDALWGEMQLAKKIQTVLLPEKPLMEGYEISACMRPADDVGGDYYDVINAGGMDWIVIGDVSGHGVPAGLVMMMAQTSINTVIADQPGISPSEVLVKVNRTLYRNIRKLRDDKYMTITVLAAHSEGRFVFSGLHQDIMVYRHDRQDVDVLDTNGMWIGVFNDIVGRVVDDSLQLQPGDCMLLYTDGITEAWEKGTVRDKRDPGRAMFGDARLRDIFKRSGARPVDEVRNRILEGLDNYQCTDDVTMLIIRRTS
jgi:serine phosphatase RsbU (regulator of sigma subunit)